MEKIILALETSGLTGSVALVSETQCLAECSLRSKLTHSRRLLESIDWIMTMGGIGWHDLAAIAISIGPGSFTGLRIGLATAKGLAMAADRPLIGVPTLDGLAGQFFRPEHLVVPVLDARKQEVYCAFYRSDPDTGALQRLSPYLNLSPAALAGRIDGPAILVGDGALCYEQTFRAVLGSNLRLPPPQIHFPRAAVIGRLGLERFEQGDLLNADRAEPLYVRASDAELNLGK